MLLRDMHTAGAANITIDKEYPGKEPTIKNFLLQLYRKERRKPPPIRFDTIGKKSPAHKTALAVFQNKKRADMVVTTSDVLTVLYAK